jgi:hypothetical protein
VNPIRTSPRATFWVLVAVTHLVSHDAVWLMQTGPAAGVAAELRRVGHGYWGAVSVTILLIGAVTLAATAWRLAVLRRRAREVGPMSSARRPRWNARRLGITWLRVAGIVLLVFAVQENVEHFVAHGHVLAGGALLGPEYPLAIPAIAAISAVAALVVVALTAVEKRLEQHIAQVLRSERARPPQRVDRPSMRVVVRRLSTLVGTDAGRAPPWLLVRH